MCLIFTTIHFEMHNLRLLHKSALRYIADCMTLGNHNL